MSMEFCDEAGCLALAQSTDPRCENTLKFKCAAHEAAARARGETGRRVGHGGELPSWVGELTGTLREPTKRGRPAAVPVVVVAETRGVMQLDAAGLATGRRWVSLAAAGRALELHPAVVAGAIRRGEVLGGRRYGWAEEKSGIMATTQKEPVMKRTKRAVRNVTTGEVFADIHAAGKSVGKSKDAVWIAIKEARPMNDGTVFEYVGEAAVPAVMTEVPSETKITAAVSTATKTMRDPGRMSLVNTVAAPKPSAALVSEDPVAATDPLFRDVVTAIDTEILRCRSRMAKLEGLRAQALAL